MPICTSARHEPLNELLHVSVIVVTLALYYVLPSTTLSWLVLLVLAFLTWWRLELMLALLPLTFPFWYVPKHVTAHAVFPLSEIILALCVVVALTRPAVRNAMRWRPLQARRQVRRQVQAIWGSVGWPLGLGAAAFLVAGLLGVVVARRPHEALENFRWEVIEPLAYLVLLIAHRRMRSLLPLTVGALLASAALLAAFAAMQVLVWHVTFAPVASGNALVPLVPGQDGALRATGLVYGSSNSLGAYLERALPFAAVIALLPQRWTGAARRWRIMCAALCVLYLLALAWSASRGAWAGAAAGLLVVGVASLWHTQVGRRVAALPFGRVAGAAGAILCVVVLVTLLWGRDLVQSALAGHNGSGEVRTLLWLAAWHMIRDHPVFGIGLDQFLYYYSNLYTSHPYWITTLNGHPTIAWREPTLSHPHNLVLDLWLSVGVLGLAAMALVLIYFFRLCGRVWRDWRPASKASLPAALCVGAGAAMVASLVHGMVDSAYFVPDLALVFWWLIAVALLARSSSRHGARHHDVAALPATSGTHPTTA